MSQHKYHKGLFLTVLFLACFGLILSTYLLYVHYDVVTIPCPAFGEGSCDIVNKGVYSEIMGFPIAGLGVIGYLLFILTSLSVLFKKNLENTWLEAHSEKATTYLLVLALGALAFTIYFNYLQIFVIGVICFWCEISASIIVVLLTLSIILKRPVNGISFRGLARFSEM